MREILERCVELDRTAHEAYQVMAKSCDSEELSTVFAQLAKEELRHVEWWSDLLEAWETGLVPDIVDEHDLLDELDEVKSTIGTIMPSDLAALDCDQMLDLAARLEFFMLNPIFGELADVMGPGGQPDRRDSYARHVARLAEAIEQHHSTDGSAVFLARMLLRANRDLQRFVDLSVKDQLTGLYNRRGVLAHLSQWLAWSTRYVRPVGIVLIDVDDFKTVNDTYGHVTGDEVLRVVAASLRRGARGSDIIGRFGGDEFLLLAPETGGPELIQVMERLLERVRETPVTVDDTIVRLSVSIGGAWVGGGSSIEAETVIAAADRSLYDAKEAGRDRASEPRQAFAPVT